MLNWNGSIWSWTSLKHIKWTKNLQVSNNVLACLSNTSMSFLDISLTFVCFHIFLKLCLQEILNIIPCKRVCCQRQRMCHTEPCCQYFCPGSWWKCSQHQTCARMGPAVTTLCGWDDPWWHQSSLYQVLFQLKFKANKTSAYYFTKYV